MKVLKNFFTNIPYNLTDRQNEQMWQTIVYVILKSVGFGVNAEVITNEGRIDMTCETPVGIWLIEFKLDRPAEEALAQIDEKNYAGKYDFAGKKVRKLGMKSRYQVCAGSEAVFSRGLMWISSRDFGSMT